MKGTIIAVASSTALMREEITLNENLSNITPQNNLPTPLNIAPQLPIVVRKESSSIFNIPYYL